MNGQKCGFCDISNIKVDRQGELLAMIRLYIKEKIFMIETLQRKWQNYSNLFFKINFLILSGLQWKVEFKSRRDLFQLCLIIRDLKCHV